MLRLDRVGLIDDATDGDGGGMVERVVDTSLDMLKDDSVVAVFKSLAVGPEDVLIPVPIAQLMCAADADNATETSAVSMRRELKKLLDRNLLQGNTSEGVQMHDIVRDLMRQRIGNEDAIRDRQRSLVQAVIDATPEGGWQATSAPGQYVLSSLRQHMTEALQPDVMRDAAAHAWLNASDNVADDHVVRSAANAIGPRVLTALAERHAASGEMWPAAKHYTMAALTEQFANRGFMDVVVDGEDEATNLIKKAAGILQSLDEQSLATRTLELLARSRLLHTEPWASAFYPGNQARIGELLNLGVECRDHEMLLKLGLAEAMGLGGHRFHAYGRDKRVESNSAATCGARLQEPDVDARA